MFSGVTPIPPLFHPERRELVAPRPVVKGAHGWPTRGQVMGDRFRRTSHGLHVPWWVDSSVPEQRIVEAAAIDRGDAAVTGWASLRWQRGRWFTGVARDGTYLPVTLSATHLRPQPGIAISKERLNSSEVIGVHGVLVTTALHSTLFEMRYAESLWSAVVVGDMAAFNDLVAVDELWPYALRHSGMTGIPQGRDATLLVDENSWSPMETVMRLIWVLVAGLDRPLTNQPVFDLHGRHVATPDLLDVESGTYGEYDSAYHLDGVRRLKDVHREHELRTLGLEPMIMMAGETRDAVAERIVATRDRALRIGHERLWTIEQPPWWIPTETVAQRRALSVADRTRLLAHRAI
jgi:hypothetical protein